MVGLDRNEHSRSAWYAADTALSQLGLGVFQVNSRYSSLCKRLDVKSLLASGLDAEVEGRSSAPSPKISFLAARMTHPTTITSAFRHCAKVTGPLTARTDHQVHCQARHGHIHLLGCRHVEEAAILGFQRGPKFGQIDFKQYVAKSVNMTYT